MYTLEVIEDFTLENFDKLKNIVRKDKDDKGKLYMGDIFNCDLEMSQYLLGNNKLNKAVVQDITQYETEDEISQKKNSSKKKKASKK